MKTLFRVAVFAAIISGMLASKAQSQSSDGRPVVEPKSELQRLQWSLESQKKQIDQSGAAAARFTAWFKQEDKRIDAEKATLRAAEQRASNARSAWNNRVNPTCEHGQTYANCSCNAGRLGKARQRDVINRAEGAERAARKAVKATIDNYNNNVAKAKRLGNQIRQMIANYNQSVETYRRMASEQQQNSRGSPDSFDDIVKRTGQQKP